MDVSANFECDRARYLLDLELLLDLSKRQGGLKLKWVIELHDRLASLRSRQGWLPDTTTAKEGSI
jgi:hypothetical protein